MAPDFIGVASLNKDGIMRLPKKVYEALGIKHGDKIAFVKTPEGEIEVVRARIRRA